VNASLPQQQQRILTAVQGYLELQMPKEALRELKTLDAAFAEIPDAVEARIAVFLALRRWRTAASLARKLCRLLPNLPTGYIHLAYCQHESGHTKRARETLLTGPPALKKEGTYYYNLACYDAVLGDLSSARLNLARCINLDRRFLEYAKGDPDLSMLHKELR
jgi:predicted Zn-dependent protease